MRFAVWLAPALTLSCAEILGADFDETSATPAPYEVEVVLAQHPSDVAGASASSTGTGNVRSVDAKLDCGSVCSARYAKQSITLNAEPAIDSAFAGWHTSPKTLCDGSRDPTCSLEIEESVHLEAYFVTRGANVWFTHLSGEAIDSADAIAVDSSGVSYASIHLIGTGNLGGASWHSNNDAADAFVVASDPIGRPQGNWSLSTPQTDSINGLAVDETGIVAVGGAGDVAGNAWTEYVLGLDGVHGRHAFVVALGSHADAVTGALPLRWGWALDGVGTAEMRSVVTGKSGRIFALGTVGGELSGDPPRVTVAENDDDILLASFESDGAPRFVVSFGGDSGQLPLPLVTQVGGDVLVISGDAGEGLYPNVRGGDCPVLQGAFLARFDVDGACIDARSYAASKVLTLWDITVEESGDIVLAGRSDVSLMLVPGVPGSAVPANATFVVRLGPKGDWVEGRSWIRILQGKGVVKPAKVTALGSMGDELLVGLSLLGDIQVGDLTISPADGRALYVLALGPGGAPRWYRSWASPKQGQFAAVAPHPQSHSWFLAGYAFTDDPKLSLDFDNVTQQPFLLDQYDAVVARIAP